MDTSTLARVRTRRYRRGLTTIPLILLTSLVAWAMAGGGDFWPKWVILWAVVAMALRASLAMHVDSDPD